MLKRKSNMHYGVWIKTNEDSKNVLILGESHHGDDKEVGRPASYPTSQVIENYLRAKRREIKMKRSWYFFTKIAHAFSSDLGREDTISFWNSVSFGNYIDVSCEVKGPAAKNYLDDIDTSIRLNDSFFLS